MHVDLEMHMILGAHMECFHSPLLFLAMNVNDERRRPHQEILGDRAARGGADGAVLPLVSERGSTTACLIS